jgi:hypothetical protein
MSPKGNPPQPSPEVDGLFAASLEDFTRVRDELAKRLRDEGKTEEAAAVKTLRKPSVPAWAVNQLARDHQDQLQELFGAGDQLRKAQRDVLRGGDPRELREATANERRVVGGLVERALSILQEAGHGASPAYRERIADTLSATAGDDEARALVKEGRLQSELRRVGFAETGGLTLVPSSKESKADQKKRAEEERRRKAKDRVARLKQKADALEEEAARLHEGAKEAEREARASSRRAEQAEARAARAREEAEEAAAQM